MNDDRAFDPEAIMAALNDHGVEYVVIGGLAVAAYGVVRATADLDLVVRVEWDNAESLATARSASRVSPRSAQRVQHRVRDARRLRARDRASVMEPSASTG